jgi:hypothetical protein
MGAGGWDRAQIGGNRRGLEARTHETGHGLFARPRMRAHTRRARTGRKGRGLQARTRGTGRGLWANTRRAQTQVNGRRRVGPGTNTISSRRRKAIRAQPLRWGHVSGCGRVRERACVAGGAGTRGSRRGARGYGGGGYKLPLQQHLFCQSLFQISSLSQHAQRALQGTVVWEVGP